MKSISAHRAQSAAGQESNSAREIGYSAGNALRRRKIREVKYFCIDKSENGAGPIHVEREIKSPCDDWRLCLFRTQLCFRGIKKNGAIIMLLEIGECRRSRPQMCHSCARSLARLAFSALISNASGVVTTDAIKINPPPLCALPSHFHPRSLLAAWICESQFGSPISLFCCTLRLH